MVLWVRAKWCSRMEVEQDQVLLFERHALGHSVFPLLATVSGRRVDPEYRWQW